MNSNFSEGFGQASPSGNDLELTRLLRFLAGECGPCCVDEEIGDRVIVQSAGANAVMLRMLWTIDVRSFRDPRSGQYRGHIGRRPDSCGQRQGEKMTQVLIEALNHVRS